MATKKYKYFYPENKMLGDQIPRTSGFIARQLLKGRYTQIYVRDVMKGRRTNEEIIRAMKYMIEVANTEL